VTPSNLAIYLILEGAMLRLDAIDGANTEADGVRDLMDPVWYRLTADERAVLDARFGDLLDRIGEPILDADGKPVTV
jgi:hypothetical protein